MNAGSSNTTLCRELELSLATSTGPQRNMWAATIVERDIDLKELSKLLKCDGKTATRFQWLLSDIGLKNAKKLFAALPFLLNYFDDLKPIYKTSFANYWLIAGLPPENEGEAIDLLFQWLISSETNITIKSRSMIMLFNLTKKYPELKNELKLCLEDQMDKHSKDFRKRAAKILIKMQQ